MNFFFKFLLQHYISMGYLLVVACETNNSLLRAALHIYIVDMIGRQWLCNNNQLTTVIKPLTFMEPLTKADLTNTQETVIRNVMQPIPLGFYSSSCKCSFVLYHLGSLWILLVLVFVGKNYRVVSINHSKFFQLIKITDKNY